MSADAKVWFDGETMNGRWEGIHDGECPNPNSHFGTPWDLREVLAGIETCMGCDSMRWVFQIYPDGKVGLKGYVA